MVTIIKQSFFWPCSAGLSEFKLDSLNRRVCTLVTSNLLNQSRDAVEGIKSETPFEQVISSNSSSLLMSFLQTQRQTE